MRAIAKRGHLAYYGRVSGRASPFLTTTRMGAVADAPSPVPPGRIGLALANQLEGEALHGV